MIRYLSQILIVFLGLVVVLSPPDKRDLRERMSVLFLHSSNGFCTGVEVEAPSGRHLVLTAAHCIAVSYDRSAIPATRADGVEVYLDILKVDAADDVMVLSTAEAPALRISSRTIMNEKIHSLSHGGGHQTYRSDGEMLEDQEIFAGTDEHDARYIPETVASIASVAGASGAPVLNERGEVVGLVSCNHRELLTGMVQLKVIRSILESM